VAEHRAAGHIRFRAVAALGAADAAVEGGIRAAQELLAAGFNETAVLCRNDLTAIGVMRGLRAGGRRIPEEISVVGYDDIELAAYVDPPLTTVRQSTDEMAVRAVGDLLKRLGPGRGLAPAEADGAPGETTLVPVELVVRESSGPAPG
jgi:DNA-binding LacI/PurR family transcriptional regulator